MKADAPQEELSVEQTIKLLQQAIKPITAVEDLPFTKAYGRFLAQDLKAPIDLPRFDNAAMDGYAIRHADLAQYQSLQIVGTSSAGDPLTKPLAPGTCQHIMTGAPLPDGADTVVPWEQTTQRQQQLTVSSGPAFGAHIRRQGEHVCCGSVVLTRQTQLTPAALGLAGSLGYGTLPVYKQLRVGLLSTGNELVDSPQKVPTTGHYDGNRPLFHAALKRLGFTVVDYGICKDSAEAFNQVLSRTHADELDVLLTTGGTALSDADIVRQAGGVRFSRVTARPGQGLVWGFLSDAAVKAKPLLLLGLPGNPVAAFVLFYFIGQVALQHLAGGKVDKPRPIQLPLAHEVNCKGGRLEYQRAKLVSYQGQAALQCVAAQGSAMLLGLAQADALVELGMKKHYAAGDIANAYLINSV